MKSLDSVVTYGVGLVALAMIVRNARSVDTILKAASTGFSSFAKTLFTSEY